MVLNIPRQIDQDNNTKLIGSLAIENTLYKCPTEVLLQGY